MRSPGARAPSSLQNLKAGVSSSDRTVPKRAGSLPGSGRFGYHERPLLRDTIRTRTLSRSGQKRINSELCKGCQRDCSFRLHGGWTGFRRRENRLRRTFERAGRHVHHRCKRSRKSPLAGRIARTRGDAIAQGARCERHHDCQLGGAAPFIRRPVFRVASASTMSRIPRTRSRSRFGNVPEPAPTVSTSMAVMLSFLQRSKGITGIS